MTKNETVLVTGGAGFIGSHVVDAYLERGHNVVVVDDLSKGRRENINPKAVFRKVSIEDTGLNDIFEEFRPGIVNHHAAQASVRVSVEDPAVDARTNIIGSLNLLELSRQYGTKKFVFASTGGAIYGEQDYFPADEKHALRPVSPYGASKASTELYLGYYRAEYGLNYTTLRYSNVFGPRQDPFGEAGVVAIFCRRMIAGEQVVINGDGRQTRDFVYVGDVVAANIAATTSTFIGVLNIGTGSETSVVDLFERIKKISGSDHEPVFGPAKPGEQRRSVLDSTLAQRELDWTPKTPLDDGLKKTVEFLARQIEQERAG